MYSKRKYLISVLGFLIFLINVVSLNAGANQKKFVLEKNTAIYKDLMSLATLWKDAILEKNFELLLKHVPSDNYAYYKSALLDKNSHLYRFLYDTDFVKQTNRQRKSVYDFLRAAKQLKIVLVAREPIAIFGVSAYYYDASKGDIQFPLSADDRQRLWMVEYVECGFMEENNEWRISFHLQFQIKDADEHL